MNIPSKQWVYPSAMLNALARKLGITISLSAVSRNPELSGYELRVQTNVHITCPWQAAPAVAHISVGPLPAPVSEEGMGEWLKTCSDEAIAVRISEIELDAAESFKIMTFPNVDAQRVFTRILHEFWNTRSRPGQIQQAYAQAKSQWEAESRTFELAKALKIDDYPAMYPLAHGMTRQFTVILGPTNSGKTYQALEMLKKGRTGVYLGPLRLLALEVHERLCADKVPCSLLTGEERVDVAGAGHKASTVEMMDPNIPIEVAVVDEIQMLGDSDRGWAWTSAVVGCPAEHMVLVGSPDVWPVLKKFLTRLGIEPNVIRTERLQPLKVEPQACSIIDARAGDAFIVFSRKDIFFYQELLAKKGFSTAIIYGALGPEVRRAEAERFRTGQAKILIATDAIGMGLNLPIARIVFTSDSKFNGEEVALVEPSLVKQIAGRAGRYGHFEEGLVTGVDDDIRKYVLHCLGMSTKMSVAKVPVAPTVEQLQAVALGMGLSEASLALKAWRIQFFKQDENFFAAALMDRVALAQQLEFKFPTLKLQEVAAISMAPLPRDTVVQQVFMDWIREYTAALQQHRKTGEYVTIAWDAVQLQFNSDPDGIGQGETLYHMATLYCWLARQKSKWFVDIEAAEKQRNLVAQKLIVLLQARAKKLVGEPKVVSKAKHKHRV